MSAPGQEQPVEGAPTSTAPETAAPSFDMSPVLDRVNELAGSIDTRFGAIEQRLPAPPEPAAPEDPWASLFADPQDPNAFEPYGQPAPPQAPQLDPQALQSAIQAAIAQSNAPLQAQLQQFQAERNRDLLTQQIPQLKDPAVAQQTGQDMIAAYKAAGQSDDEISRALASPFHIAQFFKAAEAEKLAQGQAPAGGQPPSLEAAGGALPGGNSEPVNPVTQAFANRPPGLPSGFGR